MIWVRVYGEGGTVNKAALHLTLKLAALTHTHTHTSHISQFLSISNSSEQLDDVTETMDSLFSSTLDTVAPLRLRKIKEKSQHRGIMSTLAL